MPLSNHIIAACTLFFAMTPVFSQQVIKAKDIESNMRSVNDTLYAHRYETSNREYNAFLKELRATDSVKWALCSMDSTRWTPYQYCEPMPVKYHRHPSFHDYPATYMRYEGAVEYCKWLTKKYNADPKRKFKKVEFLLPTKEEWILAALGGHTNRMYPWGNYYIANRKGFYMCNFRPVGDPYYVRDSIGRPMIVDYPGEARLQTAAFPPEKTFLIMKVRSFEANSLGLFNVCGNAAEMTDMAGTAMGGSWNSYEGEVGPRESKQYPSASPEVGFRVFMKIIER